MERSCDKITGVMKGSAQLHDRLRMPPRLVRPGAVAEPVQDFADIHVGLPLISKLCGFYSDLYVNWPKPWEQIFYGEFDGHRPKRVLVKVIGE